MEFKALCVCDCEIVRRWRNKCLSALRTPHELTKEMQEDFYKNVVCNRNARARYWSIYHKGEGIYDPNRLIGMAGLENIEWENGLAEISLILDPDLRGEGFGTWAVEILLEKAFQHMRLETVYGEVYECNVDGIKFWNKMIEKYKATKVTLPNRKLYDGTFFDSMYFSIDREVYNSVTNNP